MAFGILTPFIGGGTEFENLPGSVQQQINQRRVQAARNIGLGHGAGITEVGNLPTHTQQLLRRRQMDLFNEARFSFNGNDIFLQKLLGM